MKSTDHGKTWVSISGNLPANGTVYTFAEDHVNPNLLFAGTEFGVYFTIDGGKKWVQLTSGLPTIAVKDMAIQKRENDLVLATFGRGFYILDDYTPLRTISKESLEAEASIFPVKDALMYIESRERSRGAQGGTFFTADNPPYGATFTYYIKEAFKSLKEKRNEAEKETVKNKTVLHYPTQQELKAEDEEIPPSLLFTIADASGNVVRTLTAPMKNGVQRLTWDLRYPNRSPVNENSGNKSSGLLALPGAYSVSLAKCDRGRTTSLAGPVNFTARVLDNTSLPAESRQALVTLQRKISELQRVVLGVDRAADELSKKLPLLKAALTITPGSDSGMWKEYESISNELRILRRELDGDESLASRNENQSPSIVDRMQTLAYSFYSSTSAPTQTQLNDYEIVSTSIGALIDRLHSLIEERTAALEKRMESVRAPWTPGRLPEWK